MQDARSGCEPPRPVFQVIPQRLDLKPGESVEITLEGASDVLAHFSLCCFVLLLDITLFCSKFGCNVVTSLFAVNVLTVTSREVNKLC